MRISIKRMRINIVFSITKCMLISIKQHNNMCLKTQFKLWLGMVVSPYEHQSYATIIFSIYTNKSISLNITKYHKHTHMIQYNCCICLYMSANCSKTYQSFISFIHFHSLSYFSGFDIALQHKCSFFIMCLAIVHQLNSSFISFHTVQIVSYFWTPAHTCDHFEYLRALRAGPPPCPFDRHTG